MKKHSPVLILNSDYSPLEITDWKKAFTLIYSKTSEAYVVSTYNEVIRDSADRIYNIPAVIVLKNYVKAGNKRCSYSKSNIRLRDKNTCQYCGGIFSPEKLNVDHIIPKSRQSLLPLGVRASSFENIVCSCIQCNTKKSDKTPKEAKMTLIKVPKSITKSEKILLEILNKNQMPDEWKPYIIKVQK